MKISMQLLRPYSILETKLKPHFINATMSYLLYIDISLFRGNQLCVIGLNLKSYKVCEQQMPCSLLIIYIFHLVQRVHGNFEFKADHAFHKAVKQDLGSPPAVPGGNLVDQQLLPQRYKSWRPASMVFGGLWCLASLSLLLLSLLLLPSQHRCWQCTLGTVDSQRWCCRE